MKVFKAWPLENPRKSPDPRWVAARYKDRMMMHARTGREIRESHWSTVCDTALFNWSASGHKLSTNPYHRRTSVLERDGATRADTGTVIIQRGEPMIDDG